MHTDYLKAFIAKHSINEENLATVAYLANLDYLSRKSPEVAKAIIQEIHDQRSHLKLIASENYSSLAVQMAMSNLLTDKYAEGYAFHRFYAGCDNIDYIESLANEELKKIFGAEHAYVQPSSGADANMVAFWSILFKRIQSKELEKLGKKTPQELTFEEHEKIRQLMVNQKMMGLSLTHGGHLTHGMLMNASSKMFQIIPYELNKETHLFDYKILKEQVQREKPLVLLVGYSAYSRLIDFSILREIADSVDATLMVDMAHFAGLVAGKVMTGVYDPVAYADIVTSTTHKTLRGPRGGIVLCKKEYAEFVDKGCPLVLGGPQPHCMAAKLVAFQEVNTKAFRDYAAQIVKNAQAFASSLMAKGGHVLTGGTDNHLLLLDTRSFNLTGRQAEIALRQAGMTLNRNTIPNDPNGAWYTSAIRIGTPAMTTLGMKEDEMQLISSLMIDLLKATTAEKNNLAKVTIDDKVLVRVQNEVKHLLKQFPLYPEIALRS
ncbi:MAG: glycine hydroxymethyltransferase [Chlamydiae bacterium]|nr:glycine hydroxymethyltransferase [Chlamydiota bacterium]